jgi:hypothetical protein
VAGHHPPYIDIDPIRFYYQGLSQTDTVAACIYFYRVLEYYSFLHNRKLMQRLRHDGSISEEEFAKQVLQIITKEEKGPLLQLVNAIADSESLDQAVATGLIKSSSSSLLGESIYAFRNSIVHGKLSYGHALHSTSVFLEDVSISAWRTILKRMAKRTIVSYGKKLI